MTAALEPVRDYFMALQDRIVAALEAVDGKDALSKLNGSPVHMVLTDLNMPNMDGITFVKTYRAQGGKSPVVMVTTEAEKTRVSAQDLVDRLQARGTAARHIGSFEAITEHLENFCEDGDLVVTMGAGPVWKVAHKLVSGGAPTHGV